MKKKKDDFYFKNLNACVEYSHQAAEFLKETISNYDVATIKEKLETMHELEQQADMKRHKMSNALSQAFITPIEREDLIDLSNYLDDITDAVEEVLMQIYMRGITAIRPDVLPMLELLTKCINALGEVLGELKNFKHSKVIEKYIIAVNDLEEQGDALYMENMHRLYQEDDVRTILVWENIYEGLEKCMDTCEHASEIVSIVIMKNS